MTTEIHIEGFIKDKQINITSRDIRKLKKQFPDVKKQLVEDIQWLVQTGVISYPYKKK